MRGVNVGGKNKVSMPVLKTAFEKHGFSDVTTYINSGNILFRSEKVAEETLKKDCEAIIKKEFGIDVPVNLISADHLNVALRHAPSWWGAAADCKHNAIFVIPPATVEEVFTQVGEAKPDYEKVAYHGRVIFWSAPIKTFSKTGWSKVVQTSAYDKITIRNANTARKLAQLAE